jgi:dTDP-4-amino-4,6-dideoxygalactose transaminase
MIEMSAAIALAQFERLEYFNKKRQEHAKILNETLQSLKGINGPYKPDHVDHVYHLYVAKILENSSWTRDEIIAALNAEGIGTAEVYPVPIYKQPVYENINDPKVNWAANICSYPDYSKVRCPVTEKLCQQLIQLPVHPNLSVEDIQDIKKALEKLFTA